MEQLDGVIGATRYVKQKTALEKELTSFLNSLQTQKTMENATPMDIRMFIVHKERKGRTQVHRATCPFKGTSGNEQCPCPIRWAAKSVDSLIGKLRKIFRDRGKGSQWLQ
jgi:hypothetical protein